MSVRVTKGESVHVNFLVKVREEEIAELEDHLHGSCCHPVMGGAENSYGKVNILLQVFISRARVDGFSLVSDMAYVAQNASRIVRGLFEIALKQGQPALAAELLTLGKSVELQLWSYEHPLKQFSRLSADIVEKLESRKVPLERLSDMTADEIG